MAQVTDALTARIDRLLSRLLDEWGDVPHLAAEWGGLDRDQRIDALIDWPVVESNLRRLEDLTAQGLLTPAQCEQYAALQRLIVEQRPLLGQLIDEVSSTTGRNCEPPTG